MTEEARAFVGDLVWNDRNFMDAVHGRLTAIVNADLAAIYGVPAPAKEFDRVAVPGGIGARRAPRSGAVPRRSPRSPRIRPRRPAGLFVREQFLCQHVPDPPAGVNTNLPPVTEAKPQTNRDRMSEHATNPSCATCHKLIDPIGFGLERFDAVGARREKFALQFPAAAGRGKAAAARRRRPSIWTSTPPGTWPAFPTRSSRRRRNWARCWRRARNARSAWSSSISATPPAGWRRRPIVR